VNLRREITFHKDKSLPTIAGESNIGILGTGLTGAANPVLDIKMAKLKSTSTSKAKTLMANRVRHLLKALASRGIKPQKVTQTIVSSGSTNTLQVTASYQK
jgi:hypothetical protein